MSAEYRKSPIEPLIKKLRSFSMGKAKEVPIKKVSVSFSFTEQIKCTKITPLLDKMKLHNIALNEKEQIKRISNYAISNKIPEIIDELIELKIDLDQKVDHLNSETILAIIVQYPHYHDLFKSLVEAGATPYCQAQPGDPNFYSNALYRSVTYDEFHNIAYLVRKDFCSTQEALTACYMQNKLHMLQYFLEDISTQEVKKFKSFAQETPMSRQQEVLKIIESIESQAINIKSTNKNFK